MNDEKEAEKIARETLLELDCVSEKNYKSWENERIEIITKALTSHGKAMFEKGRKKDKEEIESLQQQLSAQTYHGNSISNIIRMERLRESNT